MNILLKDDNLVLNFSNIISLRMEKSAGDMWSIIVYPLNGSPIDLKRFYREDECQNTFNRLCERVAKCSEDSLIDLGDLWEDQVIRQFIYVDCLIFLLQNVVE